MDNKITAQIIETFPKHLRDLRLKNRMTQEQVAQAIGVVKSTISNYETGYSLPDATTMIKLCNLFNVSADFMMGIRFEQEKNVEYSSRETQTLLDESEIEKHLRLIQLYKKR